MPAPSERERATVGQPGTAPRPRLLVVGAGTRFLSAMSYYTMRVTNALARRFPVAVVPMRQMLPTFLYPGRSRVGAVPTPMRYDRAVKTLKGVDWYWVPTLPIDLAGIVRWRPDVVIFQWWTGTVLHTYLAIALMARALGASVIVEFHEVLDTGEQRIPIARAWVNLLGRFFFRLSAGFVIHSDSDRAAIEQRYQLTGRHVAVIPHGPFDHHVASAAERAEMRARRPAPAEAVNLLYFGIIRPFKGLEDLIDAFDGLGDEEVKGYWLTVVGETWEGWDLPVRRIKNSPHRDRITLVNRFVEDDEVTAQFAAADAVVLPYHRSSASGPAHVAMSNGLPLVLTAVGGLPAAVEDYEGAILVPPRDPAALRDALRRLPSRCGRTYPDPHSWSRTVARYEQLLERIGHPASD